VFDMFPIVVPAVVVVLVATALVRRERSDRIVDLTAWDDVSVMPLTVADDRPVSPRVTGGDLVEPHGSSLGARLRAIEAVDPASPASTTGQGRVRVRRRGRPLVAPRTEY
jgi:hypothetical protein